MNTPITVLCATLLITAACGHASLAEQEEPSTALETGPRERPDAGSVVDAHLVEARDAATDGRSPARDAAANSSRAAGRSAGCGRQAAGDDAFEPYTARIAGVERSYHVRVPASYDQERAYDLIFRLHGTGGVGLSGGLGIEYIAGQDVIVVAPDGLDGSWTRSSEPGDLLLFDAIYDELTSQYCIDLGRVFAYGFSAGGGFANALGCKRALQLRGTAAIASVDRADDSCKDVPIAAWFRHDVDDPSVPISQGRSARDRGLRRSGCSPASITGDGGCLQYAGCRAGYPVVWCETNGQGHDIAGDSAPALVWRFFSALQSTGD